MPSSMTASLILDLARGRHPAFAQTTVPDGSILQAIDTRQRTLLLMYGGAIDGLVNTTVDIALSFNGTLIGNDGGVPVYGTTYQDGWPQHQTDDGVPYVDFDETPIAGDPFGENGGTPGFPLPADFLKLIHVAITMTDRSYLPVDIVPENARLERHWPLPTAFISGNRIVPIRPLVSGNSSDQWGRSIQSLQLSYVALPNLRSLADAITLPAVLTEALIAGTAEFLAMNSTTMRDIEKRAWSASARLAEEAASSFKVDVIGPALAPRHVIYRR